MKREKAYIRLPIVLLSSILLATQGCSFEDEIPYQNQEISDYQPEEGSEVQSASYNDETVKEEEGEVPVSPDETIENVSEMYYGYYGLDDEQRKLYREILHALTELKEDVKVSTLEPGELNEVFNCVMNDHPEFFYVDGYQYMKYTVGNIITKITFSGKYTMTEPEIKAKQSHIDNVVTDYLAGMPDTVDEYEIVKYLYEKLIYSTEYDSQADNNQNICSVFIGGRSVCQGYAKAMQYLLQQKGMEALLVTGYTNQEGHAWNLVRVNGAYYYLDPTWGDASYTFSGGDSSYTGNNPPINYDYFLVTTEEISKTHQIDTEEKLPLCDSTVDNYYVREGLYLENYDEERLRAIFEAGYEQDSHYITLKCSNEEVFSVLKNKLITNQGIFKFLHDQGNSIAYTDNAAQLTISFWI